MDLDANPFKAQSPFLLFTGAMGTEANKNAEAWLVHDLWPRIAKARPEMRLSLEDEGMPVEPAREACAVSGIEGIGEVPDVRLCFQNASVALVPRRIGGGIRFKIMEAMAQGNLVVSTRKGVEGLGPTDGENILFADKPTAFVEAALGRLSDRVFFDRCRHAARSFMEQCFD